MKNKTIHVGMLGAGNMALAIARGIPKDMADITVFDLDAAKYDSFRQFGANSAESVEALCSGLDILVLAVKPQNFDDALPSLRPYLQPQTIVLSIAAGITISYISAALPSVRKIVRAMPNTLLMIGEGAVVLAPNENVTDADYDRIAALFSGSGLVRRVREDEINRLTAIHGSGPAYVYYFIQAMVEAAVRTGLDEKLALELACSTLRGSADMVSGSGRQIDELIAMVCSKKGTTEEAMNVLRSRDFAGIIGEAMDACANRADELAR